MLYVTLRILKMDKEDREVILLTDISSEYY